MWRVLYSETLVSNRWLSVHKQKVQLEDGMVMDDFYTVTIPDAAAIVALDQNGNIILKREYKHAAGKELIEIPAGMFEMDEKDGLLVAKRELLEETGYSSDNWMYLGETVESSSKLTNRMHIYLARNCVKTDTQHLDETEHLDVMVVPFEKAVQMIMDNTIICNSSAHGIFKTKELLKK